MKVLNRLWTEQKGSVASPELATVAVILMIGLLVAVVSVRDHVVQELVDVSGAILDTPQDYSYTGVSGPSAHTAGSDFEDMTDAWGVLAFESASVVEGGSEDDGHEDNGDDDDGDEDDGDEDDGSGDDGDEEAPLTQGFWKNHLEDWPVDSLTLGNETYTRQQALDLLDTPAGGDASIILAHQLIAAKLNVANGADGSSVAGAISTADGLLGAQQGKLPYDIDTSSPLGTQMIQVKNQLDAYNNGQ